MGYERLCAEIVTQTGLLRSRIRGADLTLPVPSCPGWNAGLLLRHLGGGHRWAEETVRTRVQQPLADDHFRDLTAYTDEDPDVLGPGRTLHFHATDTAPGAAAEWVVDLTGEAITWRRTHEKAAVAVRGPLTGLLLVLYRRRPARGEGVEILGDAELLDFWLERVGFG